MVDIYIPVIYNYIGNYNFTSKIITFYKSIFSILRRITSTQKKIPIQYSHFHYYFSTNYPTNSINKYCKYYMSDIIKTRNITSKLRFPENRINNNSSFYLRHLYYNLQDPYNCLCLDENPKTLTTAALITTFTHFLPKTNIVQIDKHSHAYP